MRLPSCYHELAFQKLLYLLLLVPHSVELIWPWKSFQHESFNKIFEYANGLQHAIEKFQHRSLAEYEKYQHRSLHTKSFNQVTINMSKVYE